VIETAHGVQIVADAMFEDCDYSDADLLMLPGGMPGASNLYEHKGVCKAVLSQVEAGKKVSAICAAPAVVLAQLGVPDMRIPIAYAMSWPERIETGVPAPDLFQLGKLTFERPDEEKFPALRLARQCLRAGGAACTVFNGANEEAVAAFLREEIPFGEIARRVEKALEALAGLKADSIGEIMDADRKAREIVRK
jgi:putative intracellular protease/amidase